MGEEPAAAGEGCGREVGVYAGEARLVGERRVVLIIVSGLAAADGDERRDGGRVAVRAEAVERLAADRAGDRQLLRAPRRGRRAERRGQRLRLLERSTIGAEPDSGHVIRVTQQRPAPRHPVLPARGRRVCITCRPPHRVEMPPLWYHTIHSIEVNGIILISFAFGLLGWIVWLRWRLLKQMTTTGQRGIGVEIR